MRDAALALLQDTFENPVHDPRDRLLLAAGSGAAIELPESVQRSWLPDLRHVIYCAGPSGSANSRAIWFSGLAA